MKRALIGPPIAYADLYQQICWGGFRILDEDIEIPVFIEYSGVEQFVFGIQTSAMPVGVYQIHIGIFILWILIEVLHIRVSRRAVQIMIIFFDVLTVIGLAVGQAESALLQDRILAVP